MTLSLFLLRKPEIYNQVIRINKAKAGDLAIPPPIIKHSNELIDTVNTKEAIKALFVSCKSSF